MHERGSNMKYPFFKSTAAAAALAMALSGCGGGSSDDAGRGIGESPPASHSITVVPSLGVVSNATVNIFKADGTSLLGSANLASAGQATVTFNNYYGPVVIEVAGNDSAQYFDEAKNGLVNFPASEKVHAIAPGSSGTFAVTMLTELAYQGAVSKNYFPLDAYRVSQINERVRLGVIPEIADILAAPTAFSSSTTAGSLANDDAGKYALKLAALAQLGKTDTSPALSIMKVLTKDLADGDLDGKDAANASVSAPYTNFSTELKTKLTAMATSFGAADLKTAVPGFSSLATTINVADIPTGGANDAAAVGVFMSPTVEGVSRVPKDPVTYGTRESEEVGSVLQATWKNPGSPMVITAKVGKFLSLSDTDWLQLTVETSSKLARPSESLLYIGCELSGTVDSPSSCASAGITYNPTTQILAFAGTTMMYLLSANTDFILTGSLRFGPVSTGTGIAGSTAFPHAATGKIAVDDSVSGVVKADGTVWMWGENNWGQLGDGTTTSRSSPVQVVGLVGVKAIASSKSQANSKSHMLALKDGLIWGWGDNSFGQLSGSPNSQYSTPVRVDGIDSVTAIAAGEGFSIALKSDGTVWAWGGNYSGQLGDGASYKSRSTPARVGGLIDVVDIAAGTSHTLALKKDGSVWAWGWNGRGVLGDGTGEQRNSPIQVGGLTAVVAIRATPENSFALNTDGAVWAWGANPHHQFGDGTSDGDQTAPALVKKLTGVVDIAGGSRDSLSSSILALKYDGTVWGLFAAGPGQMGGLTGIVEFAAGNYHLLSEASDGTVLASGYNGTGKWGAHVLVGGLNLLN